MNEEMKNYKERREKSRESIRAVAMGLADSILGHYEEFNEDMGNEIVSYLKERIYNYIYSEGD